MRAALLVLGLWGCSAEHWSDEAVFDELGRSCDADHPCLCGTSCGTAGTTLGQCVRECEASGGADCPTGAYCAKDGDQHVCVRTCTSDVDCRTQTSNPASVCNGTTNDDGSSGPDVCTGD
jgi:hypothetical protein